MSADSVIEMGQYSNDCHGKAVWLSGETQRASLAPGLSVPNPRLSHSGLQYEQSMAGFFYFKVIV